MTKELIQAQLKTKYAHLGLGDAVLGAQADYLLSLSPTEETLEAFVSGIGPVLQSYQSDLDKARAKATPPAQAPAPTPVPAVPAPKPGEEMPSWATKMFETLNSIQTQQTSKTKIESLTAKLESEKVPAAYYSRFIKTVDFEKEYDEAATLESFKTDYNEFKQTFAGEAAADLTPPMQSPQGQKANQIKADIERLA